jgi:hypothetical protein
MEEEEVKQAFFPPQAEPDMTMKREGEKKKLRVEGRIFGKHRKRENEERIFVSSSGIV